MKKFNLSLVAVLAMSTFAMAGGDIKEVEPAVEPVMEVVAPSEGGFYVGAAYSLLNVEGTYTEDLGPNETYTETWDDDFNEIMIQAGYKFNDYIAVEGRYWFGLDETFNEREGDYDVSIDAWGIYVKPMYPVTEALDIYALLGYASAEAEIEGEDTDSLDGFSWGIGAAYSFTDNLAVFVDYVLLYDDTETLSPVEEEEITIDTINFGVTYTF